MPTSRGVGLREGVAKGFTGRKRISYPQIVPICDIDQFIFKTKIMRINLL